MGSHEKEAFAELTCCRVVPQAGQLLHSNCSLLLTISQEVSSHITLPLDFHFSSALELVRVIFQHLIHLLSDLNAKELNEAQFMSELVYWYLCVIWQTS
jgi:hypothetical protein